MNAIPLSLRRSPYTTVCHSGKGKPHGVVKMSTGPSGEEANKTVLFAVRATDREGAGEVRQKTRGEHLKWAVSEASPYMEFGGPLRASEGDRPAPVEGSLLIVRGASAQRVEIAMESDPYVEAGVFDHREMRQWTCGMRSDGELPRQLYMVWCVDKEGCAGLREKTRPRHLDWWRVAQRKGFIGPFSRDDTAVGSLIVCSGGGLDEVRAWAQTDPYFVAGLFETVHVRAVTKVIEHNALV